MTTPELVVAAAAPAARGHRPGLTAPGTPFRPAHGDVAAANLLCRRCGATGTHYLTCPSLRLPPGYRLSADPRP
jgi:hypothetical protein